MAMGIGSVMGVGYTAPSASARTATQTSAAGHGSGTTKAVDDFSALLGNTQAERLRAVKFAQMGLKEADQKPVDPKQQQMQKAAHDKLRQDAAHAAEKTRLGLVADIKV